MNITAINHQLDRIEQHKNDIQAGIQIVGSEFAWTVVKDDRTFRTLPMAVTYIKSRYPRARKIAVDDIRGIMDGMTRDELQHVIDLTSQEQIAKPGDDPVLARVLSDSKYLKQAREQFPGITFIKNIYHDEVTY